MPSTELLQGTLDLLILKAVSLGPEHGYGILLRIQQVSRDKLQISRALSIPPCTGWSIRASSPRNGANPRTSAGRSSTG